MRNLCICVPRRPAPGLRSIQRCQLELGSREIGLIYIQLTPRLSKPPHKWKKKYSLKHRLNDKLSPTKTAKTLLHDLIL